MPKLESEEARLKRLVKEATPVSPVALKDRATIIQRLNHEHFGDEPLGLEAVYDRMLESKEQPYQRRIVVTEKWQNIDLSWLKDVGASFVAIENLEGRSLVVNPTAEEKEAIEKKLVEVSYSQKSEEADILYPKGMVIKSPVDAKRLSFRCRSGEARCKVTILPK